MTRPSRSNDDKLDQPFIDKAAAARAHADPAKAERYEAALARAREQRAEQRQREAR
jgi:ATPase subunit of ABC transporter with duplicated ATPase domains